MLCKCGQPAEPRSIYCKPCYIVQRRKRQRASAVRRYWRDKQQDKVGHAGDRARLHLLLNAARATNPFDRRVLECAAALRVGTPAAELRALHGRIVLEAAREVVR